MSSPSPSSSELSVSQALQHVKSSYDAKGKQPEIQETSQLLVRAKLALVKNGLLLPGGSGSRQQSKADLGAARDILSYGALLSLRSGDVNGFERLLAQLKPFWDQCLGLAKSDLQAPLTGLALLRLLANNQVAGFHTLLEELVAEEGLDELMANKHIKYTLDLERWLMEGSYSRVWAARDAAPMPEYNVFLDRLIQTARNEIASCGEKAYASLPLHDAAVLLFFKDREQLLTFASQRPGWTINPSTETISFEGTVGGEKEDAARAELPKERIVETVLEYAKELELII